jgi:guanylate kinase
MAHTTIMITVSSPSGTGKTTLCRRLLDDHPSLRYSVSTTTRAPRGAEVDGVDYHFVSDETFRAMIDAGAFVEWAPVHGHLYGTTHAAIEACRREGADLLFDVDYRGSWKIKQAYPETVTVLLLPPSMAELERRIRGRALDSDDQVALRLRNAREEIARFAQFDYIIVNDDVDAAYDRLESVYVAERCRGHRGAEAALRLIEP